MCRYWAQASEIASTMAQHSSVQRKISLRDFQKENKGGQAAWEQTSEAQDLFAQVKAYEADKNLYGRQKMRLERKGYTKSLRRSFLELFTTSKIGLGINSSGQGKREASLQSKFREAVIDDYDSKHPDWPRNETLWDPVLGVYIPATDTQAAHLFAYSHGQATMDAIFGPTDELFSPLNGLLLSNAVEKVFDQGFLAIVPLLSKCPSQEEIVAWNKLEVKEYMIRILDFQHPKIDYVIHPQKGELTWRQLDGSNIEFRNNFRPRARYLYFNYCLQVMRLSWKHQRNNTAVLKQELGKGYWGTPGRYLPKHMLLAFVEELGHEYDLMQGAIEEEGGVDSAEIDNEDSETLLEAALDQIKTSAKKNNDFDDDDNNSDDDDDDDDDDGLAAWTRPR